MSSIREMDDKVRRMTAKVGAVSAVISMCVAYIMQDLGWLAHLIGGL